MQQQKLLIVSEDPLLRAMISECFGGVGLGIDCTQESEVAAELCETNGYQAVIVDFDLPPATAYETVLFLRALGRDGTTIALVNNPNDRLNALICGASSVLSKPVSMDDLDVLVENGKRRDLPRPAFTLLSKAESHGDNEDPEVSLAIPLRAIGANP